MSKNCSICQRLYLKGNQRSHSNIATIKRQRINLQAAMIAGKRIKVCTRCLKTLTKKGATTR